jgi:hypothetical protein
MTPLVPMYFKLPKEARLWAKFKYVVFEWMLVQNLTTMKVNPKRFRPKWGFIKSIPDLRCPTLYSLSRVWRDFPSLCQSSLSLLLSSDPCLPRILCLSSPFLRPPSDPGDDFINLIQKVTCVKNQATFWIKFTSAFDIHITIIIQLGIVYNQAKRHKICKPIFDPDGVWSLRWVRKQVKNPKTPCLLGPDPSFCPCLAVHQILVPALQTATRFPNWQGLTQDE